MGFAPEDPDADALTSAIDALHASREGVLIYGDRHTKVRFVTCNESGRIVMAAPEAAGEVPEALLCVPDESADALQLLMAIVPIEECTATDRWCVFHGPQDHPRWVMGQIESARKGPWVFEGEDLTQPNILIHDEAALVRELNADREALRAICAAAGHAVESPTAVGVHQRGLHIRVKYGVVAIRFPHPATDAAHARRILAHMRERAGGSGA